MKLYQIDTQITWWVAAPSKHEAVAEWVLSMFSSGAIEEIPEELHNYTIVRLNSEDADHLEYAESSDEFPGEALWVVFLRTTETCVLACSEW